MSQVREEISNELWKDMLLGYVIEDHMARNCANYCNHFWNISLNLALYLLYKGKSSRFSGGTTKAGDRGKHLFFATFSILTLKYNGYVSPS